MLKKLALIASIIMISFAVAGCGAAAVPSADAEKTGTEDTNDKEKETEKDEKEDGFKKKNRSKDNDEESEDNTDTGKQDHQAFIDFVDKEFNVPESRFGRFVSKWDDEVGYYAETPAKLFGLIDYFFGDYDGDGEDEMLLLQLSGDDNDENLWIRMFECDKDGKIEDTGIYEFGEDLFVADAAETYTFTYEYDKDTIIGVMRFDSYWYTADGIDLEFAALRYDGSKLKKIGEAYYAGSDMEDPIFADDLKKCGIKAKWEDIYGEDSQNVILSACDGKLLADIIMKTDDVDEEGFPKRLDKHIEIKTYSGCLDAGHDQSGKNKKNNDDRWEGIDAKKALNSKGDYIIPDSSDRLLNELDLMGLSDEELRIARNEIAARHGRKFSDKTLQDYFESKSWYEGTVEADDFVRDVRLSEIELENMDFIKEHEESR